MNIIKGCPGCGKSGFMKYIAAHSLQANYECQYIHCSGDPDSLDAIWFPQLSTGYVDGTPPHALEPAYPGAVQRIVDLGAFLDYSGLETKREKLISLTERYKREYATAYDLIKAGAAAQRAALPTLSAASKASAAGRAETIVRRELKKTGKARGAVTVRYLDALTCKGAIHLFGTVRALADKVIAVDNEYALAPVFMDTVLEAAVRRGYDCVRCLSPADQSTAHVIIPQASIAFVSRRSGEEYDGQTVRRIHLDSIADRELTRSSRQDMRRIRRISDSLNSEAVKALARAKSLHDELEAVYNPFVNFSGVTTLAQEHCRALGI